jgi:hypothetical protein
VHAEFWWEHPREVDHYEDLGVDRRTMLKWNFKNLDGGMNWTDLTRDRNRWPACVNAAMESRVPKKCRVFLD